jgi:prophage regulatory protein
MQLVTGGAPPNTPIASATEKDRLLRLPDVEKLTGCGKSTVYGLMAAGKFPKNLRITRRLSCWKESDVQRWIAEQSAAKAAA